MSSRITRTSIKDGQAQNREFVAFDAEVRGFGVRFRPGYSPSFFFRYQLANGARRKLTIGFASEFTPEKARDIARGYRERIAKGEDPALARDASKAVPVTVAELKERYMKEHAHPHKKPSSAELDEGLWRLHLLPRLGSKRVDMLDVEDVLKVKTDLVKTPAVANQCMALLSKALGLAEIWKYRPANSNPCRLVKKYPHKKRKTILTPDEITRFGEALEAYGKEYPHVYHLIMLMILTGGRWRTEIAQAKIAQYDPSSRRLNLPDSKTGEGFIPLSKTVCEFIENIPRGKSPWLIPGPNRGQPVKTLRRAWAAICKRAKIERGTKKNPKGLRPHDLRHCFGSYSHHFGASLRTIAELLRHKQLSTTEGYMQEVTGATHAAADRTAKGLHDLLRGRSTIDVSSSRVPGREDDYNRPDASRATP